MRIDTLLEAGVGHFRAIEQDQTVEQALKLMKGYDLSILVVETQPGCPGIFTGQDLMRCHLLFPGKALSGILVKEVMTSKPILAHPQDTVDHAVETMIKAKARHLPVILDDQVKGVLTLEELVIHQVGVLTQELHYLKNYIKDLQDAAQD